MFYELKSKNVQTEDQNEMKTEDPEGLVDSIPPNPWKVFVTVSCIYHKDGNLMPVDIEWINGKKYKIDEILDVRNAASLKAGGIGVRYECMIAGCRTYLYFEKNRWFMERSA